MPGVISGASLRRTDGNHLAVTQDAWSLVEYDQAIWDTDGYWSAGSPGLLTAPFDGVFLFGSNGRWSPAQNAGAGVRNQWIGYSTDTPASDQALAEVEVTNSQLTGVHIMQPLIGPPIILDAGQAIAHYAYKYTNAASGTLDFQALTGRVPAFWIVCLQRL